MEAGGIELVRGPYQERRAVLEDLFAREVLAAPFTLCPATIDRQVALDWLDPAWGPRASGALSSRAARSLTCPAKGPGSRYVPALPQKQ